MARCDGLYMYVCVEIENMELVILKSISLQFKERSKLVASY